VILDSHLRLPLESRLVESVTGGIKNDLIVFCSYPDEKQKRDLEACGIRIECIPPDADGRPDFREVLRFLGKLEITSVMIEGGSQVNATALAARVVDKVFLYYAPTILGEAGSVPFVSGESFGSTNEALQVKHLRLHRFGEDFAVEGYLRDPYDD
jgi:diaminohydroxyphosphoribosylaminopyrimidine deaminase/5-amino-6-(5-phosphoribosylamino)uracil reductase